MRPEDIPQEVVDAYKSAHKQMRKEIGRGIEADDAAIREGLTSAFYANLQLTNRIAYTKELNGEY